MKIRNFFHNKGTKEPSPKRIPLRHLVALLFAFSAVAFTAYNAGDLKVIGDLFVTGTGQLNSVNVTNNATVSGKIWMPVNGVFSDPTNGSPGLKLNLYGGENFSTNNYALGVMSGNLWLNSGGNSTGNGYRFYLQGLERMSIGSDGMWVYGPIASESFSTNQLIGTSANGKKLVSISIGSGLSLSGSNLTATGGSSGEANTISSSANSGASLVADTSKVGVDLRVKSLSVSSEFGIATNATNISLTLDSALARDSELAAQGTSITNAIAAQGTISTNSFVLKNSHSGTMTVETNSSAGTGSTVVITNVSIVDRSFQVQFFIPSLASPSAGALFTVTYAQPFAVAPNVFMMPANSEASAVNFSRPSIRSQTTTNFIFQNSATPPVNNTAIFNFLVQ